ncbi:MAG: hypothetical protein ACOCUU_01400 [Nanoarchaeota archaeon]
MIELRYNCDSQETRSIVYGKFLNFSRNNCDYLEGLDTRQNPHRFKANLKKEQIEINISPSLAILSDPVFMTVRGEGEKERVKTSLNSLLSKIGVLIRV